jgi:hypothetical protein
MNFSRFVSHRLRRRPRPVSTPTALSLLLVLGLLAAALLLPDRIDNRALAATGPLRPNITPGSPRQGISFRDRLIVGLQARRGSEVAFIDDVVLHVRLGKLPERLVNQTFFWSRDRAKRTDFPKVGTQRPIIYFQPVMTRQARQLGVKL